MIRKYETKPYVRGVKTPTASLSMTLNGLLVTALLGLSLTGCETESRTAKSYAWANDSQNQFESAADRPPTPQTLRLMARILAYQGKEDQAEMVFKRLLDEHRMFLPAYCDLAELQIRRGRLEEAMHTLAAGLDIAEADPVLLNNMGLCMLMSGHADGALSYFVRAAEARPENARFRANAALALGLIGRYEESLQAYRSVADDTGEAHYNLAVVCEARGDYRQAATQYARAAALNKDLDVKDDILRLRQNLRSTPEPTDG